MDHDAHQHLIDAAGRTTAAIGEDEDNAGPVPDAWSLFSIVLIVTALVALGITGFGALIASITY